MAKRLKSAELFLSLGLVVSLATACGTPEGGEGAEDIDETTPTEEVEGGEVEEGESEEGGEGGEGGEGASSGSLNWASTFDDATAVG
ncbi:MAG: hypothetical protein WA949_22910 [Phormidesmis sp.]